MFLFRAQPGRLIGANLIGDDNADALALDGFFGPTGGGGGGTAPDLSTALVIADFVAGTYQGPSGSSQAIGDFLTGHESPTANGLEILVSNSNRPVPIGDLAVALKALNNTVYIELNPLAEDDITHQVLFLVNGDESLGVDLSYGGSPTGSDWPPSWSDWNGGYPEIGTVTYNAVNRVAGSYTTGGILATWNGAEPVLAASVPTSMAVVQLGHVDAFGAPEPFGILEGYLRRIVVFPLITDEATLQALSDTGPVEEGTDPEGVGAVTLTMSVVGQGVHGVSGAGATTLQMTVAGAGAHGVTGYGATTLSLTVAGQGATGVKGVGAVSLDWSVSGQAAHGIAGAGAVVLDMAVSGQALVVPVGEGAVRLSFTVEGRARHFGWRPTQSLPTTWTEQTPGETTWTPVTSLPITWS